MYITRAIQGPYLKSISAQLEVLDGCSDVIIINIE